MLKTLLKISLLACLLGFGSAASADSREMVELPEMMRVHMLSNMRDHLVALNEILHHLAEDELEKAADVAEARLGFSSLELHGASHIAQFMPEEMSSAGTRMHRAASQFARTAQEGDVLAAYRKLQEVTTACVECHAGYKVQ